MRPPTPCGTPSQRRPARKRRQRAHRSPPPREQVRGPSPMRLARALQTPETPSGLAVIRLDALDREFLPAALELLETPPSPIRVAAIWVICAGLVVALAWSYFGKLDIHAVAQGRIQPSGRSKVVQPLEPGKIVSHRGGKRQPRQGWRRADRARPDRNRRRPRRAGPRARIGSLAEAARRKRRRRRRAQRESSMRRRSHSLRDLRDNPPARGEASWPPIWHSSPRRARG